MKQLFPSKCSWTEKLNKSFFYNILLQVWRLLPDLVISHSFSRQSSQFLSIFDYIPKTSLKLTYLFKCGTLKKTDYSGWCLTKGEQTRILVIVFCFFLCTSNSVVCNTNIIVIFHCVSLTMLVILTTICLCSNAV